MVYCGCDKMGGLGLMNDRRLMFCAVFLCCVLAAVYAQNDGFVPVKGGTFLLGGRFLVNGNVSSHSFEQERVRVNDFYISPREVTQKEFEAVTGKNPSRFKGEGLPVESVSFKSAILYCNELSKAAGLEPCYTFNSYNSSIVCDFSKNGYRLPTEAEWEYAARGGSRQEKGLFAGSDAVGEVAWYGGNSGGTTHPAGAKKSNALGLYDMAGNVWEWCWDYRVNPEKPDERPVWRQSLPYSAGELRYLDAAFRNGQSVIRGGAWNEAADACSVFARAYANHEDGYDSAGFRLVRNAAGAAQKGGAVYVKKAGRDLIHAEKLAPADAAALLASDMLYVAGGSFQMGFLRLDGQRDDGHKVTLDSFYCGRYEVTLAQWLAVMKEPPRALPESSSGADPVTGVSWYEAVGFCNALSVLSGLVPCYVIDKNRQDPANSDSGDTLKWTVTRNPQANGYRLPTEAEWEFIGRGGMKSQNSPYVGNESYIEPIGWYGDNSGYRAHPVGLKKSNELGLFDLAGNAFEWCWDYYDINTVFPSESVNPAGAESGYARCIRGGSYDSDNYEWFMPFARLGSRINQPESSAGLRLVRNAPAGKDVPGCFF